MISDRLIFGCWAIGLLASVGLSGVSWAEEDNAFDSPAALTLRGFGTAGVTRSTSDEADFVRDLSQPRGTHGQWTGKVDSNFGLQVDWSMTPSLEVVGQVVSRYRYDDSFRPEVSLAFVKWRPDPRNSVRVGRVGADFLMLADSRLIGYSNTPVRPSVDYFGQLFFSYLDGADVVHSLPVDDGVVKGKLFAGRVAERAPYSLGVWDTSGSAVAGAILSYEAGAWLFRGSAAGIRFSHDHGFSGLADALRDAGQTLGYAAAVDAAEGISAKGSTTAYYSLGFVYDDGPMLIQAMVNQIHHQSDVFQNSRAAYLLAGYRLASLTPYVGVSRVKSAYKSNSSGLPAGAGLDPLIQAYDRLMLATAMDQTTWTLGTRWDFRRNMALKIQWDAIRGDGGSRFLFSRPSADWDGTTHVLSATLDFVF